MCDFAQLNWEGQPESREEASSQLSHRTGRGYQPQRGRQGGACVPGGREVKLPSVEPRPSRKLGVTQHLQTMALGVKIILFGKHINEKKKCEEGLEQPPAGVEVGMRVWGT